MLDVGWFVHLFSSSVEFPPRNPDILVDVGISTYFSTHVSPFVYLTTLLYDFVDNWLAEPVFFSLFMGIIYGSAVYLVMLASQAASLQEQLASFFLAIIVALNGIALGAIGFPHFEVAMPVFIMLFLVLWIRQYQAAAIVTFVLALTLREDAGLHSFLLIAAITVAGWLNSRKLAKSLLWFAFAALLYSVTVIAAQKLFFTGDNAFQRIYSGAPFYAHINAEFLASQFWFYFEHRAYIWGSWCIAILLFICSGNWLYLAGFAAVIPWTVLSVTAVSPMANSLSNYYAFPLIISVIWPVLVPLFEHPVIGLGRTGKRKVLSASALRKLAILAPVSSLLLFPLSAGHIDNYPWKKMGAEHATVTTDINHFSKQYCEDNLNLGKVLFDEAASVLVTPCLKAGQWEYLDNYMPEALDGVDTFVFSISNNRLNGNSKDRFLGWAEQLGLDKTYRIGASNYVVVTRYENPSSAALLQPFTLTAKTLEGDGYWFWQACALPAQVGAEQQDCSRRTDGRSGYLSYGPYVELASGLYTFELELELTGLSADTELGHWDVYGHYSGQGMTLSTGRLISEGVNQQRVSGTFQIPEHVEKPVMPIEIRLWVTGADGLTLKSLRIKVVN